MAETLALFAACSPGLEPWLESELRTLGLTPRPEPGGFAFAGTPADALRANRDLRSGLFVSWILGAFRARQFPELVRKAKALPWRSVLNPDDRVDLRVTTRRSRLYHSEAVAERLLEAITASVPSVARADRSDDEAVRLRIRLASDQCTVAVDTSGRPLTSRGYRLQTAKAPLRTDIAWVMLELGDFRNQPCIVDPMCGAGTLPIEAALALYTRTGSRSFALQRFPAWRGIEMPPASSPSLPTNLRIVGGDRDAGAVAAARDNAERAGVADRIDFRQASLSESLDPTQLPDSGLVVVNPPYGHRIAGRPLGTAYRVLGRRIAALGPAWTAVLACPDPDRVRQTGLPLERRATADHGGIRVGLYRLLPSRALG